MLYFAYGSNMNEDELKDICVTILRAQKAILRGYKIALTHKSSTREGGTLDIVPSEEGTVEGVLYQIPDTDKSKIDEKEGVNSGAYEPVIVDIEVMDGKTVKDVISYQVRKKVNSSPASPEYKKSVLSGAKAHGLSEDYMISLQAVLEKKKI